MSILTLETRSISIGNNFPLLAIMGLNVLEDESLALEVAAELKSISQELGFSYVFKASFDKANRSSIESFRGPGIDKGLAILEKVKSELDLPVITDIHEPEQAERAAAVAEIVQIPAFLCRQTDLIVAATEAVLEQKGLLHIKKGQFLAPWDCKNIVDKVKEVSAGKNLVMLCERGTSFGYNNLVVDFLGFKEMRDLGVPVTIDATHAVQLPGIGKGNAGENSATAGRRSGVPVLAKAAVAAGADGVFLEFHPDPDKAKCDGPSCLSLADAATLLRPLKAIREATTGEAAIEEELQ